MTTLYHYCPTKTFHSIIEKRSIWLSSLFLSSDSMEGRLVTNVLAQLARADKLPHDQIQYLIELLDFCEKYFDGLGFCLSEEKDLLSQWRGYTIDATGFSIGFSKVYLDKLVEWIKETYKFGNILLDKVEYKPDAQKLLVTPFYQKIKKYIDGGALNQTTRMSTLLNPNPLSKVELEKRHEAKLDVTAKMIVDICSFYPNMFLLKSIAFREEVEWRLVSLFSYKSNKDKCLYRCLGDRVIPYKDIPLIDLKVDPIARVMLGPKNVTPIHVIEELLMSNDFKNVEVIRSEASYR